MTSHKIDIMSLVPLRDGAVIRRLLATRINTDDSSSKDGRSPWYWAWLANGDLMVGFFPQADTFSDCENAFTEDGQAAQRDGTMKQIEVPLSTWSDIPAGLLAPGPDDEQWIAWPRSEATSILRVSEMEPDEQIDVYLREVTRAGVDVNQRRIDLERLAEIIQANPRAGFGRVPLDTDVHDSDCLVCNGACDDAAFALDPPGLARDGHPYTDTILAGTKIYVVDQEGATCVFPHKPRADWWASHEAASGAISLVEFTVLAPRDGMSLDELADYACSHGPDFTIKPEFQRLVDLTVALHDPGTPRADINAEYLRGQVELLNDAGAVEVADPWDYESTKVWLSEHIINRITKKEEK